MGKIYRICYLTFILVINQTALKSCRMCFYIQLTVLSHPDSLVHSNHDNTLVARS